VRGINSEEKWNPIRDTLSETACDIFCLQETKRESFDLQFIRKFSPHGFDSFEFLPSIRASGGLITVWKALSSVARWSFRMLLLSQLSSLPGTIVVHGF